MNPSDPAHDHDLGDVAAVYREHAAQVSRWARRLAGPDHDIEDVVHDVFVVALRRARTFDRDRGEVGAWLHGITVKVVQTHRRRVRLRRLLAFLPGTDADDRRPEWASASPDPEQNASSAEAMRRLYQALEQLSEKHRTAFILHDIDGCSGEEIARITSVSLNNVWVRVHRARRQLASALEGAGADMRGRRRDLAINPAERLLTAGDAKAQTAGARQGSER